MLKWFAKYQKFILVVGGSVLMVLFLLPNAEFLVPDPASEAIGYIDREEITGHDHRAAAHELDLLQSAQRRLMIHAQTNPRRQNVPPLAQLLTNAPLPDDPLHWLLLLHEAKSHGVWASEAQGQSMLLEISQAGIDIAPLLAEASEEDYARAFARWQAFMHFTEMILGGGVASEPRVKHLARDTGSQATIEFIALDPADVVKDATNPADKQVREQFEKYKDQRQGQSEPFGYGYIVPPRVKIEYIAVPLPRVAESVKIDEVEAREYYEKNPREFIGPPTQKAPEPAGDGKGEETQGAAEPPAEPAPDTSKPRPYRQVRKEIIDKLADQKARARQAEIVRFIQTELNRSVTPLAVDDRGYRVIPSDYQPPSPEDLARRVQERFGVLPDVVREDRWLTRSELADMEGIGDASLDLSGRPISVADYALSTHELKTTDESAQLAALRLQVGIPSRPVQDAQNTSYTFRIVAADPEHAPESLDEVHEKVVGDLKNHLAYEALKARAEELAATAREEGLDELADEYEAKVEKAGPFSAYDPFMLQFTGRLGPPQLPVVGQSAAFVEAVFDVARSPGADTSGAGSPEGLIAAVPVDSVRKLVVFKITEFEPVDIAQYEARRPMLARFVFTHEMQDAQDTPSPLTLEAVRKRVGYKPAGDTGEEEEAATAGESAAAVR